MSAIVDQYGRPLHVYSQQDVEEHARFLNPIVGSMLNGPNPILQDMFDLGAELRGGTDLSPFIDFVGGPSPSDYGLEYSSATQGQTGIVATMNDRFSKRNPVAALNIPRDPAGIMTMSMKYAEDNYIVARGIKTKKNFAMKDLTLLGRPTTVGHYTSEYRRLKVRQWVNQLFRYYFMLGRVVMYWGEDRPVQALSMLDPRLVNVRSFMGIRKVYLKPDRRWRDLLKGNTPEGRFLKRVIPQYWKKFINNDEEIELKDGTYALIENDLSLFSSRGISPVGGVPLQPAFNALQIMNLHLAGDFSVAWMMKNLIALVSIGDPSLEKERYTRADQVELQKLQAAFQKPEYAMWAYVDPTVAIRYIHPDPKLYDTTKYQKMVEIIEYVMGLPAVFGSTANSQDFNSSMISLKPFREEIEFARADIIDQFFSVLNPVLREGYTRAKAGTKDPEMAFDQNCLKEDARILEELTAQYDRGALSMQSLLEGKAQDLETEMKRKQEELKNYGTVARPIWDMNHGTLTSDEVLPEMQAEAKQNAKPAGQAGRPNKSGRSSSESTGGSTPRPSRS